MIADCAMDLYASRLMVLHTAWKVENGLPHRQEVAMTKTFVSEAFGRIVDRAVQIHGAAGHRDGPADRPDGTRTRAPRASTTARRRCTAWSSRASASSSRMQGESTQAGNAETSS